MTLIAGIISRRGELAIPSHVKRELRRVLSRDPADRVSVHEDSFSFIAHLDLGIGIHSPIKPLADGVFTIVAGELHLDHKNVSTSAKEVDDAEAIRKGNLEQRLDAVLQTARGAFCSVYYDPLRRVLTLSTDKLGIRPLYYWVTSEYVVFANALRILEALTIVPKEMNFRAVTEIVGFGYPLADRTPYSNIFVLKSAEIAQIDGTDFQRRQYWKWDQISTSAFPEKEHLRKLYSSFSSGVALRNQDDRATIAYLSGGLDSRCVVAVLRAAGVAIHTFNFAREGTQDAVFGNEFAACVESIHEHLPKDPGDLVPDYSAKMAEAWRASKHRASCPVERPNFVWSGEGGSVALGHVHLNENIVQLMRAGKTDDAIETFFRREGIALPMRLFMPKALLESAEVLHGGVADELAQFKHEDAGRNFYLFLMVNDQRRKLYSHFENIDLHRLEFQLPFFDSEFLSSIIATPLDLCLRHKFYVNWLEYFGPCVTKVPWQAYPDHVPCPLPQPQGLSYQWAAAYQTAERAKKRERLLETARTLLAASEFPSEMLSKWVLRLSAWIHATGFRDYEYVIEGAETYYEYWNRCNVKSRHYDA